MPNQKATITSTSVTDAASLSILVLVNLPVLFPFPPWHRCGITALPTVLQIVTVLRLWLMKLLVALYLRRLFHTRARWSQGLHTYKEMYKPRRKPILKHWSFTTQSLPTLFYNLCGLFARGLGCHYAVQCLDLQAFTLWFGGRMLSLKNEGIKHGLTLSA